MKPWVVQDIFVLVCVVCVLRIKNKVSKETVIYIQNKIDDIRKFVFGWLF